MITIRLASADDVTLAHQLEEKYSDLTKFGSGDGFFIKCESPTFYQEMSELGCMRIAHVDGHFAGFAVVIPSDHPIMHRLFDSNCFIWMKEHDLNATNCCWAAKLAVDEQYKRSRVASKLVHDTFTSRMEPVLTATALSPVRNRAIEGLSESFGMIKYGLFVTGPDDDTRTNTVWCNR